MKPLNKYIIIDEIKEDVKKTSGGLLLAEKHREDIRYRKAKIIAVSASIEAVKADDTVWFDRAAGYNIEFADGAIHKVIKEADVIIVE